MVIFVLIMAECMMGGCKYVYMIWGRRPGHEVLKNATCRTPGKARPTHEEVVHDDESGCNEDRSPHKVGSDQSSN